MKPTKLAKALSNILSAAQQGVSKNDGAALAMIWELPHLVNLDLELAQQVVTFLGELAQVKTPFAGYAEYRIIDFLALSLIGFGKKPSE